MHNEVNILYFAIFVTLCDRFVFAIFKGKSLSGLSVVYVYTFSHVISVYFEIH